MELGEPTLAADADGGGGSADSELHAPATALQVWADETAAAPVDAGLTGPGMLTASHWVQTEGGSKNAAALSAVGRSGSARRVSLDLGILEGSVASAMEAPAPRDPRDKRSSLVSELHLVDRELRGGKLQGRQARPGRVVAVPRRSSVPSPLRTMLHAADTPPPSGDERILGSPGQPPMSR